MIEEENRDSDQYLISGAKMGDEENLDCFLRKYSNDIYKVALGVVKDPYAADDVRQETLMKITKSLDKCRPEGYASCRAWVLKIASNTARNYVRKRKSFPIIEYVGDMTVYEDVLTEEYFAKIRQEVDECLRVTSKKDKEILRMYFLEKNKLREVAEQCEKSVGSVRQQLYRAIKRIKRAFYII